MKWKQSKSSTLLAMIAPIVIGVMFITPGCGDVRDTDGDGVVSRDEAVDWYQSKVDDAQAVISEYGSYVDVWEREVANFRLALDETDPGSKDYADILRAIEKLEGWIETARSVEETATTAKNRYQDLILNMPDDWTAADVDGAVIGDTVKTVSATLPPPWNFVVYGIAGLVPFVTKKAYEYRNERNAVVQSIDTAKRKHPEFATAINAASDTIRRSQGAKVAEKVDKIRAVVVDDEVPSK